ncbi:hypothetical protein [Ureibacillus aquaedulcis]|uniref:Uncharacterized protein n=1 Tax=Ureibacillus aquaedulcis TaxID=3058421 RepID=A0ABT8GVC8_9BACL|nr:hypothetical protein [Ureibacillus sp. BA0131]MDN4495334.1 hypothetical protein [Ureibacillus sp. BA0131]
MEGIIMMVVLFIISSILGAAKNKPQNQKAMPPFNNQPTKHSYDLPKQPEQRKSLEDFAGEVFQQLSDKSRHNQPIEKEVVAKQTVPKIRPVLDGNRSSNRSSATSLKTQADPIKQNEIGSLVPTTRNALVQAIITTEILAPPKAKRK